ncbi:hypothetical protein [Pseudomonas sp. MWU13-3659]|uniref:hypothetical protein n=1 Tax=Pseudomonas sp. MWU13-3659 TaxID=2986964 RepID=UPI002076519A|nr:hypothetical protein [Pseudomonas sp. MWU13-3659]
MCLVAAALAGPGQAPANPPAAAGNLLVYDPQASLDNYMAGAYSTNLGSALNATAKAELLACLT